MFCIAGYPCVGVAIMPSSRRQRTGSRCITVVPYFSVVFMRYIAGSQPNTRRYVGYPMFQCCHHAVHCAKYQAVCFVLWIPHVSALPSCGTSRPSTRRQRTGSRWRTYKSRRAWTSSSTGSTPTSENTVWNLLLQWYEHIHTDITAACLTIGPFTVTLSYHNNYRRQLEVWMRAVVILVRICRSIDAIHFPHHTSPVPKKKKKSKLYVLPLISFWTQLSSYVPNFELKYFAAPLVHQWLHFIVNHQGQGRAFMPPCW